MHKAAPARGRRGRKRLDRRRSTSRRKVACQVDDALQWRVQVPHEPSEGGDSGSKHVAADLGIDLDQAQTTVDSLVSLGLLFSLMDGDDRRHNDYRGRESSWIDEAAARLDYYTERATRTRHFNDAVGDFHINLAHVRRAVDFLRLEGRLYADIDDVATGPPHTRSGWPCGCRPCVQEHPTTRCELRYAQGNPPIIAD